MKYSIQFVLVILFCFNQELESQTQFTPYDDIPGVVKSYKPAFDESFSEWQKMLYDYPINYNDLKSAYELYTAQNGKEKSPIIRYFKIWERAILPHVNAEGEITLPNNRIYQEKLLENQLNFSTNKSNHSRSSGDWTFLGPKNTYWLNESGTASIPDDCPWQVNVYSFDVANTDHDILYAGTETGFVNKSTDKGLTWSLMAPDYFFGGGVKAVAIHPFDPNTVYVSAGNQIHKSVDGGDSWTPLLTSSFFSADRLAIDGQDPEILYAASNNGLYKTENSGETWERKSNLPAYDVEIRPENHDHVFALVKSGSLFGLIESVDGGQSFDLQQQFPNTFIDASGGLLAMTPSNPDLMYCILLSNNNTPYLLKGNYMDNQWQWETKATGNTTQLNLNNGQGYYDLVLAISPANENIIMVGTTTLFGSINGGNSFGIIGGYGGNFPIHPDMQDIKILDDGDTWLATDGGMNLSTDFFTNTSNHFSRTNGIVGSDFWGFDQGWNEDITVGGRYHNGNTAMTDFYQDKALRMGGAESPTGWVMQGKSRHVVFDDLGSGWILPQKAEGNPEGRFIFSKHPNMDEYGGRRSNLIHHPHYNHTLFVGEGNGFWQSDDMGETWSLLHTFDGRVRYMQLSYANPNVMYADVDGRGLYRSSDGGNTWELKPSLCAAPYGNQNWRGKLFFALSPHHENDIYACLQNGTWSSDIGKVFKSSDGGDTWEDWTGTAGGYLKSLVVQPYENNQKDLVYLFVNARNGESAKVYYRTPEMSDWQLFEDGFPAGFSVNLALPFYRDSKLRVAGNAGVWETPLVDKAYQPVVIPMVEKAYYDCHLDTVQFDCHSIVEHEGATWSWSFEPEPLWIDDANQRNPKVVFGSPGSYSASIVVLKNGSSYERTIANMITLNECPSVEDCNNPTYISKSDWSLIRVNSEEVNFPGLARMSFDDDPATIWHTRWSTGSDPYPHEIEVSLGKEYQLFEFVYQTRQDGQNGRIKDFELFISTDSLDWGEPVYKGQFTNTPAPQKTELGQGFIGKYFKFRALSEVNGNAWASAAEFDFQGCFNRMNTSVDPIYKALNEVKAFPVPTEGIINISLPNQEEYEYQVFDISGKIVSQGKINSPVLGGTNFQLDALPNGMFYMKFVTTKGVVYQVKVLKQ